MPLVHKRIPLHKGRVELNISIFDDKKISDLQRRLDTQYDKIDEVEEAIVEALRYFQMIPSES